MKKRLILPLILLSFLAFLTISCNNHHEKQGQQHKNDGPIQLSNTSNRASCVYLTSDLNSVPAVSWVEIDSSGKKYFYFERWNQETGQFDAPHSIPIEQNASIHEEGMPKIAFKGDGSMMAMYETSTPAKGKRFGIGDILYLQSFDGGKNWTNPKPVFRRPGEDSLSFSFGDLTRLADGEIGASCLGTSQEKDIDGRPVLFTRTSSGEKGFGKVLLIDKEACQCCRTAISDNGEGQISIAYRDLLPGSVRDISLSISTDTGRTFTSPDPFSDDHWKVDGCPHDGPSVVVRHNKTYAAWFSGGDQPGVHYGVLDSSGKMLLKKNLSPNGHFIQVGVLPDGTRFTAYDDDYKTEKGDSVFTRIMVNKINQKGIFEKEITPSKAEAAYPVVMTVNDSYAIVAWTDSDKTFYKDVNISAITQPAPEEKNEILSLKPTLPDMTERMHEEGHSM